MYYYHPHTGRFEKNTRSTIRASTVGPVSRRGYDDDLYYVPKRTSVLTRYDTTSNEYNTAADINKELIMSSAAMEDNYDISNRSRQRDRDVIAAANRAINTGDFGSPVALGARSSVRDASLGIGRRSTVARGVHKRSRSTPVKRPTYTTTELVLPLDLKASEPPKPSPYLSSKYKSLRNRQFEPKNGQVAPAMYSRSVRTSFTPQRDSPFRDVSPFRSESSFSRESPFRSTSPTSLETTTSLAKKRYKPPRVLASKRRVGNYYNRLLTKKSAGGKTGKYWPYIDVEDIEYENISDLVSDTDGDKGQYDYAVKVGDGVEYDTYEPPQIEPYNYVYEYDNDSDIPDEYVPFRPRQRVVSPERDYSQLSVLPYLPTRDSSMSVADEISFNAVVAQSAARARKALDNIDWNDYESAGLVLSVEGEYKPPQEQATPIGFRYISRPIMLKVPAAQRVSYTDSDNSFTKYMTDLRKFRDGVRLRLEEGYRTLCRDTQKHYTPSILPETDTSYSTPYTPYVSKYRPSHTTYRRYLADDSDNKYGHSLELYPSSTPSYSSRTPFSSLLSVRSSTSRALPSTDDDVPHSHSTAIRVYDPKADSDQKLGTLARVEIKAALLASKVETMLPPRKRHPKSAYAQAKIRQMRRDKRDSGEVEVVAAAPAVTIQETSTLRASPPVPLVSPDTYQGPMSDARRRARRVLAMTRNDPK